MSESPGKTSRHTLNSNTLSSQVSGADWRGREMWAHNLHRPGCQGTQRGGNHWDITLRFRGHSLGFAFQQAGLQAWVTSLPQQPRMFRSCPDTQLKLSPVIWGSSTKYHFPGLWSFHVLSLKACKLSRDSCILYPHGPDPVTFTTLLWEKAVHIDPHIPGMYSYTSRNSNYYRLKTCICKCVWVWSRAITSLRAARAT